MGIDSRWPCIIGVGQRTWRQPGTAPEPLAMWEEVAGLAAADAGRPDLLGRIDALGAVHCFSWAYDDPAARLAERLGARPVHQATSIMAGTSTQRLVNAAAERMLAGDSELALVVGAEALATKRRLRQAGERPAWSFPAPDARERKRQSGEWIWPSEWAHGVLAATLAFAALDTSRRGRLGIEPAAYQRSEAELLARFTEVAAANPYAWFPTVRSAEEIATVTAANRMIDSPYTKYMVAIMDVDMAAGLVLATHGKADELGVAPDRRVYLRGWSFGRDATHLAERPFLDRSPAMAEVSADALARAGIGIDDVDHLDLYSCFASSVLYAADALGLSADDPRGLTVAGGLPYHGGPASNYLGHSIAGVVERLRAQGRGYGLVSGVGLHMGKHVYAVYGAEPGPVSPPDYEAVQARVDRHGPRAVVEQVEGRTPATVAAYSVSHDHQGRPQAAVLVAELADGSRAYARTEEADAVVAFGEGEWVGRPVLLAPGPAGVNQVRV